MARNTIKVKELIELLQGCNPDALVYLHAESDSPGVVSGVLEESSWAINNRIEQGWAGKLQESFVHISLGECVRC